MCESFLHFADDDRVFRCLMFRILLKFHTVHLFQCEENTFNRFGLRDGCEDVMRRLWKLSGVVLMRRKCGKVVHS